MFKPQNDLIDGIEYRITEYDFMLSECDEAIINYNNRLSARAFKMNKTMHGNLISFRSEDFEDLEDCFVFDEFDEI